MPLTEYINITIGGEPVDVGSIEDFPISVSYALEDSDDFQKKKGAEAVDVELPASKQNQKVANSYHNPNSEDLTPGQVHKSHQPAIIEANGVELLAGKAFLEEATHSAIPESYKYNFYGANTDWKIDLQEKTLYDLLSNITFINSTAHIVLSWNYDGRDETMPYVFAPVKYRGLMDVDNAKDDNMSVSYLRPSISKYWMAYWGFKSIGYRIAPGFMDTDFFRRQVMPWTWGNFLQSEGTKLDVHKFLVKSKVERFINSDFDGIIDLNLTDTGVEGAFDNNNEVAINSTKVQMEWEYKVPNNGALRAFLSAKVSTTGNVVGENSYFAFYIQWAHLPVGGVEEIFKTELIFGKNGSNLTSGTYTDFNENLVADRLVNPGDKIIVRFPLKIHEGWGIGARVNFHATVNELTVDYAIPPNGTISFQNYLGFKKLKFLDFIAGIADEFNLSITTDSVNKVVFMEPTHGYNADGTPQKGYFNSDFVDWTGKMDVSKRQSIQLFSDYERELLFKYKDDGNDGVLKVLQDRNQNTLAASKYVFPDRFKAGKREHENRFFSPTVHYEVEQWKHITGIAPQMVCIIPENISNTSNSQADNTFNPKSCYYKGLVTGMGGWKLGGEELTQYPYMFAVNYKPGGELDPVLSYSDEKINGVIAKGLMKQFFTQRLAIMRNGQYYNPAYMMLNDNDVNRQHREHKAFDGQKWELVQINNYLPLKSESTACLLRKWVPISQADYDASFPSEDSVLNATVLEGNDIKYAPLIALQTDVTK